MQYALYSRVLVPGLDRESVEERKRAMLRWFVLQAIAWVIVLAGAVVYVNLVRSHVSGLLWILPALGAVVGTGIPLQLAVGRIARSALR
ncbi:MAG: hypothetical protein J2P40_02030 [Candidatus Dormibacteraeota bacterium]|nr:hypothetical protein [Candidatus Dormibacteraeota bacterium]MBO0704887.1 hypothetical protein [Candidatus Dormibacteraeota bacterium]MBO0760031.1 hypothetical protein [Candidatus Dormibacteraeota bacterium]